eukprot:scaffold51348_cov52-Prasinocladus_malaysianus.AAC.3
MRYGDATALALQLAVRLCCMKSYVCASRCRACKYLIQCRVSKMQLIVYPDNNIFNLRVPKQLSYGAQSSPQISFTQWHE